MSGIGTIWWVILIPLINLVGGIDTGINTTWLVSIPLDEWYWYHLVGGINTAWWVVLIPLDEWYRYHLMRGINTTWFYHLSLLLLPFTATYKMQQTKMRLLLPLYGLLASISHYFQRILATLYMHPPPTHIYTDLEPCLYSTPSNRCSCPPWDVWSWGHRGAAHAEGGTHTQHC